MRRAIALAFLLSGSGAAFAAEPAEAVFAGGCFWSVEKRFDEVPGVLETTSGFSGGTLENPSYRQVVQGRTGHLEAVRVRYDPNRVSYEGLLDAFWRSIDPTDDEGQFCDKGPHYRTAVFVAGGQERAAAETSKQSVAAELGQAVATEIRPAAAFYAAEDEHQDFHIRNPAHYEAYRIGCGRDAALARVWGASAADG